LTLFVLRLYTTVVLLVILTRRWDAQAREIIPAANGMQKRNRPRMEWGLPNWISRRTQ
jgi:hypothetical protein